jgi:hydroxymethylbilane synthase
MSRSRPAVRAPVPVQVPVRVGTRGSALALEQTRRVVDALAASGHELAIETRVIATQGDVDKQTPLAILGGHGVFAKELEAALLAGEIDLAVHSAKDLTSELPEGLRIGAVPPREDPRDVLVSRDGRTLAQLPGGARVGTSSRRRVVQLRRLRPDLTVVELRGNLDTRLRKIAEGQDGLDAGILAAAGIVRMGWEERITEYLPLDDFVPAPGQGALAAECRDGDAEVLHLLTLIDDENAAAAVTVERAFLRAVGGGCRSPIAAHATIAGGRVRLRAMFADEALTTACFGERHVSLADAEAAATELAGELQRDLAVRARAAG